MRAICSKIMCRRSLGISGSRPPIPVLAHIQLLTIAPIGVTRANKVEWSSEQLSSRSVIVLKPISVEDEIDKGSVACIVWKLPAFRANTICSDTTNHGGRASASSGSIPIIPVADGFPWLT